MDSIKSMTGFAREQGQGNWGFVAWEIRSVNHRYLDISLKMPDTWRELEVRLREMVQARIKRGKVDAHLHYIPGSAVSLELEVNTALADQLTNACRRINKEVAHPGTVNPMDILRWPGVVGTIEQDLDIAFEPAIGLFQDALDKLILVREREGAAILETMLARLDRLDKEIAAIKQRVPEIAAEYAQKLTARLDTLKSQVDPARLEQEIVIFSQKVDIAEEVDRVQAHVAEAKRVMQAGGAVGRRIDFITQELNREANTIAAKSVDLTTTHHAVELKVVIEQLREQAQNLE